MSNNYPYRQPPSDSDLRRFGSGADRDFYRQPQEFSSSSRSSAALQTPQASTDGVLSLLNSCGLEPEDLSLLAKLPEDILTVESLPHILKQIKGKKEPAQNFPPRCPEHAESFTRNTGTIKPLAARAPSPPLSSSSSFKPFSSAHWPSASSASRDWEQHRRQPSQYPLHLTSSSTASEPHLDRWAGHKTSRSAWSPPSSSRRPVDHDHRPRPLGYGKEGGSLSKRGSVDRARPSRFSVAGSADYRTAAPRLDDHRRDSRSVHSSRGHAPSSRGPTPIRRGLASGAMPSKKQALDFHGASPAVFPYSCSLCDITVLSEKTWIQHTKTTGHADGQLNLLQKFPSWDCRLETAGRDEKEQKDGADAPPTPRPNQNRDPPTSKKQQKASDKGKVVCAKFPPQSVDEAYLRKLIEKFGKIGKILMFPSLAFVEMSSCDQAKDLVKFYSGPDEPARKDKIEFSISNAFSFLQSSQVVSFIPAPTGEDGRSDLICIAKRFGEPLYTLFLPSKAFVEMKLPGEAQKLVDYYSSNTLKINSDVIQVSFSSEYRTLMRVPLAQKYEEAEESTGDQGTGSRERRGTRTRSRERRETRTRSRSKEKSRSTERHGTRSPRQTQSEESESRPAEEPQEDGGVSTNAAASAEEEEGDEDQSTADDSDIEGMEVLAEDGENLNHEDDLDSQEERSHQPEDPQKSPEAGTSGTRTGPPGGAKQDDIWREEEEAEFPVDLENCITLDEVKSDEDEDEGTGPVSQQGSLESSRVLFFSTMPQQYTDMEFVAVMRGFGTVVRYLLTQNRQQGFVEMSTSSEALKAAEELRSKPTFISGTRLVGTVSEELSAPTNGWSVPEEETSGRSSEIISRTQKEAEPEPSDEVPPDQEAEPDLSEMNPTETSGEVSEKLENNLEKSEPDVEESTERKRWTRNGAASRTDPNKRKRSPENEAAPLKTLKTEEPAEPPEQEAAPAEGATETERPVGAEFVRPVVGYFCHLCQLIFSDEDEAKLQHCSTPSHYRKYQEKTGKDPWLS